MWQGGRAAQNGNFQILCEQFKMIPLGDQQPFLLQLGKLYRHGGAFHAEKIRQLLTVKGNVKGEGGLPDGFGRQVG